jgi:hypothetical protein
VRGIEKGKKGRWGNGRERDMGEGQKGEEGKGGRGKREVEGGGKERFYWKTAEKRPKPVVTLLEI